MALIGYYLALVTLAALTYRFGIHVGRLNAAEDIHTLTQRNGELERELDAVRKDAEWMAQELAAEQSERSVSYLPPDQLLAVSKDVTAQLRENLDRTVVELRKRERP